MLFVPGAQSSACRLPVLGESPVVAAAAAPSRRAAAQVVRPGHRAARGGAAAAAGRPAVRAARAQPARDAARRGRPRPAVPAAGGVGAAAAPCGRRLRAALPRTAVHAGGRQGEGAGLRHFRTLTILRSALPFQFGEWLVYLGRNIVVEVCVQLNRRYARIFHFIAINLCFYPISDQLEQTFL